MISIQYYNSWRRVSLSVIGLLPLHRESLGLHKNTQTNQTLSVLKTYIN